MLLWLNGMTTTQKTPMETLMDNYVTDPSDILPLLIEDEFFIQAKNLNPKVIDFIRKYQHQMASQLLNLVVQDIIEVNDINHDQVVVYPILATEFFELDLPPLTQMMLQEFFIETLFQVLNKSQDQVHEPQWSNIYRLFTLMISKEPQITCQVFFQICKLKLFLNHLQSATVNNILIQLFNPENGNYEDIKLEVLILGFKGFEIMDEISVLNFTYLVHEIMTRYFSNDFTQQLVKYIVSFDIIKQMFNCLEKNHDKLFLAKSSAHILSLISNFYSYTMQNINIYEETFTKKQIEENPEIAYHTQLTNDFENSDFMKVFPQYMYLFVDSFNQILQIDTRKLRTLRLKLLEIFDNLTRISNIKLWKTMNDLKLLNQIVEIYFKYSNSDIYHSIFEKLLLYILNRAISDFHPYWCIILIEKNIDIYSKVAELIIPKQPIQGYIYLLANHLCWFQKELNEKLVIDGSLAKYYQSLKTIEENILLNDKWRRVVPIINLINQKNGQQLGSSEQDSLTNIPSQEPTINNAAEPQVNNAQCLFNKVKNNVQQNITNISGDEPPEFESPERGQEQQSEEYQYESKKSPEKKQSPAKNDNEFIVPQEITLEVPQTQNQPIAYNVQQAKDYNFVQDVYLSPTKQKQEENTQMSYSADKLSDKKQEKEKVEKRVDMMSISLQDFVRPVEKRQFFSGSKNEQSSSGEIQASPVKKTAQDVIKKYTMSKSITFGQAQQTSNQQLLDSLSLTRKKSMESSLKLKQLDSQQREEFKILLTSKEDTKKILTNDTNRILMVDELDKVSEEKKSLIDSIVNLSNISFSSTSSKKRTIKFRKQQKTHSLDQNMNHLNNVESNEEIPQNNKILSFSLTSSQNLRDSFLSSQSSVTEEKKFKKVSKKDQQFLNYIRNIK